MTIPDLDPIVKDDLPLTFEGGRRIGTATVIYTAGGMHVGFNLLDEADINLTVGHIFRTHASSVDLEKASDPHLCPEHQLGELEIDS